MNENTRHVRISVDDIKVLHESGYDMGTSQDEIYLCTSAAAGGGEKQDRISPVEEGVNSGQHFWRDWVIWSGHVPLDENGNGGVLINATLWEEDNNDANNALQLTSKIIDTVYEKMGIAGTLAAGVAGAASDLITAVDISATLLTNYIKNNVFNLNDDFIGAQIIPVDIRANSVKDYYKPEYLEEEIVRRPGMPGNVTYDTYYFTKRYFDGGDEGCYQIGFKADISYFSTLFKSTFSAKEVHSALSDYKEGMNIEDVMLKHKVHIDTFEKWKEQFIDTELSVMEKLHEIKQENRKLRKKIDVMNKKMNYLSGSISNLNG